MGGGPCVSGEKTRKKTGGHCEVSVYPVSGCVWPAFRRTAAAPRACLSSSCCCGLLLFLGSKFATSVPLQLFRLI